MKQPILSFFFLALITIINSGSLHSQSSTLDISPEDYFDFWIGEWDMTWLEPDSTTGTGFNKVEWILDGTVIKENFEGLTGSSAGYIGKSYSVYKQTSGEWKQTWVDNTGDYLDFTGEFDDDKRMFTRTGTDQEGELILQRMIFYNIQPDSFTWDWESSRDNGSTWALNWRIQYERIK